MTKEVSFIIYILKESFHPMQVNKKTKMEGVTDCERIRKLKVLRRENIKREDNN